MTIGSVLFLPHGGGPLPLMGDPDHAGLTTWLTSVDELLGHPRAVLMVSAHWEAPDPTVQTAERPPLLFDYGGFPPETYEYSYPAPGDPDLAARTVELLDGAGLGPVTDATRGFDHGMFVPMMLMYPDASIPTVQLSLVGSLDPATHLAVGQALGALVDDGVAIIGSGLSFHNMAALASSDPVARDRSARFDDWLVATCTEPGLTAGDRERRLIAWETAPEARYAHPREEHLLPLHVCVGAAGAEPGRAVYRDELMGKRVSAFLW